MADFLWAQGSFSTGEISPKMYARFDVAAYYKALKTAKNILPTPQGGARKRFGTIYDANLTTLLAETDYQNLYPIAFDYLNECIYQVIFYSNHVAIFLEGTLQEILGSTGITGVDIATIDETVLESVLSIVVGFQAPQILSRSANSANAITAADTVNNFLTVTNNIIVGSVNPASFTTSGSLPTTNPPIQLARLYFIKALTATTVAIYTTSQDAANDTNRYTISALGSNSNLITFNNWMFGAQAFSNVPTYDFNGGYSTITFTPGATTGTTTLTASGTWAPTTGFVTQFVGGIFTGGGGTARITAINSTTQVAINVIVPFSSTSAIPGTLATLTEPAWSNLRGWPSVNGSFQNRAMFASTTSLPNGTWLSVPNDYYDFDDSEQLDDNAISYYPTSDVGSNILFITPYRSLLIHTNAGAYSTSLNNEVAVTPDNFSLVLQDSTPPGSIQPVAIDNQIMIVSGVDVNSLLWEFGQSAYVPNLISAISEHLITDPFWITGFRDRFTEGGRYLFVSNADTGKLAMFQTLLSEELAGWTWAQCEQSYGNAYIRHTISSVLGRCWFIVERQIASAQTPIAITGFNVVNNALTAIASNFSLTVPTEVLFTTTGVLPTTSPQINTTTYYWAIGLTADTFRIYQSQADALVPQNVIAIVNAGTSSNVVPYTLATQLNLEELSYNVNTDCTIIQNGTNLTQATGLSQFNGQMVTLKGDGLVWDQNPVLSGTEQITIMGQPATANNLQIGFPINYEFEPLPLAIPMNGSPNTNNLTEAKHIRHVNIMFNNSIGGQVNSQNVVLNKLATTPFLAPVPLSGIMQVSLMQAWNQFESPEFTITQSDPYDFNVIGIFYRVEV